MLIPSDRAHEEADILAAMHRGESVEHFETVRIRKDGAQINVSATISPIRDGHGTIVGASKIARDITERKRFEETVRQSNARRRFALDTAKLGDWELDLRTMKATRSLLHDQIFGYSSILPEWSFEVFMAHIHPDDRATVRKTFESSVREKKRWEFECRLVCRMGCALDLGLRRPLPECGWRSHASVGGIVGAIAPSQAGGKAGAKAKNVFVFSSSTRLWRGRCLTGRCATCT